MAPRRIRSIIMQQLWDISPPVSAQSPVFPGDTPYSRQWNATIGPQCPVTVSQITLSPHVGTPADAPFHSRKPGAALGHPRLEHFLGPYPLPHVLNGRPLLSCVRHP